MRIVEPVLEEVRPTVEPPTLVEAIGVERTYRTGRVEVRALTGVDLVVKAGEMVAIMGPSGCGKTTLLNCLSGLDTIDAGDVLVEGVSLASMSDRERTDYRARHMGFVFQFYNLMPVLNAVENVELPLLVARCRAAKPGVAPSMRSSSSDWHTVRNTYPTSSRAANGSASRSHARWSTTRRSSGRTSRLATWTARVPTRSPR